MIGPTNIRGVVDATFKWMRPAPTPRASQKSACSLAASSSSIGPTTSVGEPAGEHDFAGQIEGWLFLLASGLVLERVLGAVSITFRPISAAKAWSYGWNIRRANGSH
jgi:hypothetical protein